MYLDKFTKFFHFIIYVCIYGSQLADLLFKNVKSGLKQETRTGICSVVVIENCTIVYGLQHNLILLQVAQQ
jgi:hypothetical protein